MTNEQPHSEPTMAELKNSIDDLRVIVSNLTTTVYDLAVKNNNAIEELAIMTARGFREITNDLNSFKKEMYEFRDEMYAFKDEMYAFRDEMYQFRDETHAEFRELRNINIEKDHRLNNHEHRLCKVETKLQLA
ncbi:MAG: hypothetical protein WC666_00925 [Candidatus Paceibacterota bacterium]|jgi:predicted RNase H-like nuclease (RuvC/YqgF family)